MTSKTLDAGLLDQVISLRNKGRKWSSLAKKFNFKSEEELKNKYFASVKRPKLKILLIDIETAPILAYVWGLWDQNIPSNMVVNPTTMLAWAAKWYGEKQIFYADVSKEKNRRNDKKIVSKLAKLINEADILVAHNLDRFDRKKTNTRVIINKLDPISPFNRKYDTLKAVKKFFAFESNKIGDVANYLNLPHKKYAHAKFPGNTLFVECLNGNKEAWKEMRKYNPQDILVLEDLFTELIKHDPAINFDVYSENQARSCPHCGDYEFWAKGFRYTQTGKFQKYRCLNPRCKKWFSDRDNLFTKEKRKALWK